MRKTRKTKSGEVIVRKKTEVQARTTGKVTDITDYKKKAMKKAKRNKRRRRVTMLVFLTIILVGFVLFAPFFNIQEITCTGNEKLSAEEIIRASTIGKGRNIYRTSLSIAQERIEKLPYIHTAELKRVFPNGIAITVTESTIAGFMKTGDVYIYIDKYGTVLEHRDVPPEPPAMEITNSEINQYTVGEQFGTKTPEKAPFIISALQEIANSGLADTATLLDIPDIENMTITLNNQLQIVVGNSQELNYKISFLTAKAYEKLGPNAKGMLDVSSGKKGVYSETVKDKNEKDKDKDKDKEDSGQEGSATAKPKETKAPDSTGDEE